MSDHGALVVDLDGTLTRSDTLWESLILLVSMHPIKSLAFPFWLLKGRAYFKARVADCVRPDPTLLPYASEVVDLIREQKRRGSEIILTSAGDERIVKSVAEHVALFDSYIGSREENLKGDAKLAAIRVDRCGRPFSYVGNDVSDVSIWQEAAVAYAVGTPRECRRLLSKIDKPPGEKIAVHRERTRPAAWVHALRPYQWIKNLLLFLPLLLAHELGHLEKFGQLIIAFAAMSLSASAVYVTNDILDLESDRRHPTKRTRPFASGQASVPFGLLISAFLVVAGVYVSSRYLPRGFTFLLLGYLLLASLYSLCLRRSLVLDIICLAALYAMRVLGGGLAVSVPISNWLLAFSIFLFVSLASVKRYIELLGYQSKNERSACGRDYQPEDLPMVLCSGLAAGYMSILVFFLYISSSAEVRELYPNPTFLWLIGPVLMYWITRIWFLARRGEVDSDPVLFPIKDRISWVVALLCACLIVLSAMRNVRGVFGFTAR